ncbi:MAG: hypothetical protein N2544_04705, partial [Burkholderiales bacterium]|nr:hypothetical protein [Burkholderiales bacterium]
PSQFVSNGGIVALSNGNYVVLSRLYSGAGGTETGAGAVTWGSGATGVTGVVGVTNSIRGNVGDQVGSDGITELVGAGAGNFVIKSPLWNGGRGAVPWVDGSNGFASGAAAPGGFVTAANSLTGTATTDSVGSYNSAITPLSNGNYVLLSPDLAAGTGAATLVSGVGGGGGQPIVNGVTQPIAPVSATNSLVGSATGDFANAFVTERFGASGSFYALFTTSWGGERGAVTLSPSGGAGAGPVGPISAATSIVGTTTAGSFPGDQVGSGGLFELYATSGKFVLLSPEWGPNAGARGAGAITLVDSANLAAARGAVSPTAGAGLIVSLVGSAAGDRVGSGTANAPGPIWLSNGVSAIHSPYWNGGAGAVTFVDTGSAPAKLAGTLSSANSLVGATAGDRVGTFECDGTCSGIVDMLNGKYLVRSPGWTNTATSAAGAGAVTLVDPVNGSASGPLSNGTGVVGTNNSIHGTTAQDRVGGSASFTGGGVVRLDGDRFAILSPDWNHTGAGAASAGAVTFGSLSGWAPGPVTTANSLVGTHANDRVGSGGIEQSFSALGVFGITSFEWNQSAGAVTFFDAASPPAGQSVSAANSLVGGAAGDVVGGNGWFDLGGGRALVLSAQWGGASGAATVVGLTGPSRAGVVTAANSFTGNPSDQVGWGGAHFLPNGNFLVVSPNANGGGGAVTFMTPTATLAGQKLSSANSLVGTPPYGNLGRDPYTIDVRTLGSGDYIVVNPNYGPNGEGMIVYGSATTGVTGAPSLANGWVGTAQYEALGTLVTNLPGSSSEFVFNAPGATKNGNQAAGRLFIANPAGLGAPAYPLTGDVNFGDAPGTDITINPSQITAITNTGTRLVLEASNDVVLKAGSDIVTVPVIGAGGELRMSAGRSIILGSSIVTGNANLQLVANATAADGVVDADRLPGAAEIRMAAGTSIDAGSGNVTMRIGDGAGLTNNTAGGITLGNVTGLAVDIQNVAPNPTGDAARSITQLPGTGISAASLTMLAEGDIRLGGSIGAPAIAAAGGVYLQTLGAIVAGGFTDIANQDATITLNGKSVGAAGAPVKLVVGQDVDAATTGGGIYLEQVAGLAFTSSYNVSAPLGQTISLASSGGDLYVDDIVAHPGNVLIGKAAAPYRIQIGFGITGQSLTLDAPGGIAVGNTAVALNAAGGIAATGAIDVAGGTALTTTGTLAAPSVKLNTGATGTFNGAVTASGFTVDGALATLNAGSNLGAVALSGDTAAINLAAAATATSLAWTGTGSQTNTLAGGSLTVSGPATIGGQGTRNLSGTNLVLNGASAYGAGTGALNLLGTAAIANNGTFTIANDNPIAAPATSLNTFTNNGTLAKNAGTGTTTIGGPVGQITLVNNGTVQVNSGTLALASGGSGGGAYAVAPGATLAFTGGTQTLSGSSSVGGGGTVALSGTGTVVDVGGSYGVANTSVAAGTLKLQGPATGLQTVNVGGAGAVLNVNGTLDAQTLSVGGGSVDIAGSATVASLAETGGSVAGTGNLTVTSSYSRSGGTFGSGWNALSVTQASGALDTAGFGALSQLALAAPAGILRVTTPISTGASMTLTGGAGVDVNASVDAGGALAVSSGGAVNVVNGALSSYGSTVSVSGTSLTVSSGTILGGSGVSIAVSGPVTVQDGTIAAPSGVMNISAASMTLAGNSASTILYAGSGFAANIGGDVTIAGGPASGASAEIYASGSVVMNVGGNLVLTGGSGDGAYASITGNPDLGSLSAPLKVGGTITMTTGSGLDACAAIESVSKDSVYVFFPFLASGGYTVDGAAVTSNGISGFFAGGVPAILDRNLFILYGLSQLTDAVGVSLQQTYVPFEQDFRMPENRDDLEDQLAELDDDDIGACQ